MILYMKNPKESLYKALEIVNEFGETIRNSIQKSILYPSNEPSENEIKKTILPVALKNQLFYLKNLIKEI